MYIHIKSKGWCIHISNFFNPAYSTNYLLGFLLGIVLIISNNWHKHLRGKADIYTFFISASITIICGLGYLSQLCYGHHNSWGYFLIYLCETVELIFEVFLPFGSMWATTHRFHKKVTPLIKFLLTIPLIGGIFLAVTNLFVPLCFSVSADNIITQHRFYTTNLILGALYLIGCATMYLYARFKRSYYIRYPSLQFVTLVFISAFYELTYSTPALIWITYGIVGAWSSLILQREYLYHDKLVNANNRRTLYLLRNHLTHKKSNLSFLTLELSDTDGQQRISNMAQLCQRINPLLFHKGCLVRLNTHTLGIFLNSQDTQVLKNYRQKILQVCQNFEFTYQLLEAEPVLSPDTVDEILLRYPQSLRSKNDDNFTQSPNNQ
ncbi:hypothetical protein FC36_GL001981 [Ligilactobacillus equi DSM 15833 = JCM 10991]|uniref:Uncharacterized protein n=1 Tax=Ligilactobacillus equi DSM 15833 = JCM 10991 TaxID=1423740 RepID=A0A0R1TBC1_9LACO|nr:hypothetical protein FC36_GL001981 [Ligilactobacillus equi DSM 15833 = JCM 10991]